MRQRAIAALWIFAKQLRRMIGRIGDQLGPHLTGSPVGQRRWHSISGAAQFC